MATVYIVHSSYHRGGINFEFPLSFHTSFESAVQAHKKTLYHSGPYPKKIYGCGVRRNGSHTVYKDRPIWPIQNGCKAISKSFVQRMITVYPRFEIEAIDEVGSGLWLSHGINTFTNVTQDLLEFKGLENRFPDLATFTEEDKRWILKRVYFSYIESLPCKHGQSCHISLSKTPLSFGPKTFSSEIQFGLTQHFVPNRRLEWGRTYESFPFYPDIFYFFRVSSARKIQRWWRKNRYEKFKKAWNIAIQRVNLEIKMSPYIPGVEFKKINTEQLMGADRQKNCLKFLNNVY